MPVQAKTKQTKQNKTNKTTGSATGSGTGKTKKKKKKKKKKPIFWACARVCADCRHVGLPSRGVGCSGLWRGAVCSHAAWAVRGVRVAVRRAGRCAKRTRGGCVSSRGSAAAFPPAALFPPRRAGAHPRALPAAAASFPPTAALFRTVTDMRDVSAKLSSALSAAAQVRPYCRRAVPRACARAARRRNSLVPHLLHPLSPQAESEAAGVGALCSELALAHAALAELYIPFARGHSAAMRTLSAAQQRPEVSRTIASISVSDERVRARGI